jgi:hypothetical protein
LEVTLVGHWVLLLVRRVQASVATRWDSEPVVALHEASCLRKWRLATTVLLITLLSLNILLFNLSNGLIDLLSKVSLTRHLLLLLLLHEVDARIYGHGLSLNLLLLNLSWLIFLLICLVHNDQAITRHGLAFRQSAVCRLLCHWLLSDSTSQLSLLLCGHFVLWLLLLHVVCLLIPIWRVDNLVVLVILANN